MFRSLFVFLLASSLLAFCQTPAGTTVNGGYIAPAMPGAPILTPPNVALPGSGPATGEPPAIGVNDARTGGSGSVYQPSAGTLIGGGELNGTVAPYSSATTVSTTGATSPNATTNANQPLNVGLGTFVEAPASTNEVSLGDIARRYKTQRANAHPRQFDNSSVRHGSYGTAETNSAALPQSDQPGATYGSTGTASTPEGVLNPADYAAVQAALARSQATQNTNASNNTVASAMADPNRSLTPYDAQSAEQSSGQQAVPPSQQSNVTNQSTEPAVPQASDQARTKNVQTKNQLPASASPLPLIAVLGLIALAVGGIFSYRLRRNEA